MNKYTSPIEVGDCSPWGRIDHVTKIAQGIYFVSTPSHGGIWISPERQQAMPEPYKSFTSKYGDIVNGFYEEDCDWVIPTLAFASEMEQKHLEVAKDCFNSNQKYYNMPALSES